MRPAFLSLTAKVNKYRIYQQQIAYGLFQVKGLGIRLSRCIILGAVWDEVTFGSDADIYAYLLVQLTVHIQIYVS